MPLTPDSVDPDPITQFRRWFEAARAAGVSQPDAMTLATATTDGGVTARTVLLRGLDERGFVFYTNLASAKGGALAANPRAALLFHWREQERQVRIVGPVERVDDATATSYWESRPRGHQVSAWASRQSEVVDDATLAARVAEIEARFAGVAVPLPPFWGGYRVGVDELELWQGRADRLHDRVRYRRPPDAPVGGTTATLTGAPPWVRERLAP